MRAAELLRENEKLLRAGVQRRRRMRRPHAKRRLKGVDFKPSRHRGTFTLPRLRKSVSNLYVSAETCECSRFSVCSSMLFSISSSSTCSSWLTPSFSPFAPLPPPPHLVRSGQMKAHHEDIKINIKVVWGWQENKIHPSNGALAYPACQRKPRGADRLPPPFHTDSLPLFERTHSPILIVHCITTLLSDWPSPGPVLAGRRHSMVRL